MFEVLVIGATSNLAFTLLATLPEDANVTFHALVREESKALLDEKKRVFMREKYDSIHMVPQISAEEALKVPHITHFLWLSTHDDIDTLGALAAHRPTLAIGSGAVLAFYLGHLTTSQLNGYQQAKFAMCNHSKVAVFCPGFYIEDSLIGLPSWFPQGLHGDTSRVLFGKKPLPAEKRPEEWFARRYSVTPKTAIHRAILDWIARPEDYKEAFYVVSSDREFARKDLYVFAEGEGEGFPLNPPIYEHLPHVGDRITTTDVRHACLKATKAYKRE